MQPLVEIGVRQTGHDMNDQSQRQEQDKTLAVPTDSLHSFLERHNIAIDAVQRN